MSNNSGRIITVVPREKEIYHAAEEQELGVVALKIEAARKKKEMQKGTATPA